MRDKIVAFGIFGLSLIALYLASSLYHLLPLSPAGGARLRKLDHVAIFSHRGHLHVVLPARPGGRVEVGQLAFVWGLALCGVSLKHLWMDAPRWLSVALYLGMGWVALVAVPALLRTMPPGGIAWVLAGG